MKGVHGVWKYHYRILHSCLHDCIPPITHVFDLPFDEIAPIVGRSPTAARQLASRARRRVQGADAAHDADHTRRREIVGAFLAASRSGNFGALLAVLDPDVVLRADSAAVRMAAARQAVGAPKLAPDLRGA